MTSYRAVIVVLLIAAATLPARAYELAGYYWVEGATTFQVDLSGTSPSGVPWQSAFSGAASEWTGSSAFDFSVLKDSGDPCATPTGTDDVNSVMFSKTNCGSSFGSSTLAVAKNWSVGEELVQAGIIFNTSGITWDVYSGSWGGSSRADFRRVAVHELGHTLGLAHASGGIMSAYAGNTETPQADDLDGVAALYGTDGSGNPGNTVDSTDDALLSLSTTFLDYGNGHEVGDTAWQTFSITNIGGADAVINGFSLSDTDHFQFDAGRGSDPCEPLPVTLPPDESCTVGVGFKPQRQGGFDELLNITADNPPGPVGLVAEVACSSNDLVLKDETVSGDEYFTACQSISASGTFKVANGGGAELRAGTSIRFGSEFTVARGGRLAVVMDSEPTSKARSIAAKPRTSRTGDATAEPSTLSGTRTGALPDDIGAGPDEERERSLQAAADGALAVYEPESRRILVHEPGVEGLREVTVAGSGRVSLVQGDFDGDGLIDVGTFRAIDGLWTIYPGEGQPFWRHRLGGPGDVPVPADYDGDGRTDLAVWSPATGEWRIKTADSDEPFSFTLGSAETDVPVPADYSGNGRADPAVWSSEKAEWRVLDLKSGQGRAYHLPGDPAGRMHAAPGDYDGDGRADPALFDDVTGTWSIRGSRWAENQIRQFTAAAGARPASADYDGDGETDPAWWLADELVIELSATGQRVNRSLRGMVPLSTRPSAVDTDRRAAH